ncbi:MAG: hypothetical protein HW406_79 [Candidatus Brocadiaceae bacterium]|nr:hypothetical protein [Candidatus Brocadiaceae bacterium]
MNKVILSVATVSFFIQIFFGGYANQPVSAKETAKKSGKPVDADDLLIVDCLLPGKLKKLGNMSYLSPRRPVRTTALDCRLRGGEYVAYDRSNYETTLKVWMEKASEGDVVAQTYVGDIYEKGLGRAPDYAAAAEWYKKAANQGYAPAQINLGQLYERGLGVEKDMMKALEYYRKASGLNTAIVFESDSSHSAVTSKMEELRQEVERRKKQEGALQEQLKEIQQQLEQTRAELEKKKNDATKSGDASGLQQRIIELEGKAEKHRGQLETIKQAEAKNIGPTIEMLDSNISGSKSTDPSKVSRGAKQGIPRISINPKTDYVIRGKVNAPSGLSLFTVNDREGELDKDGLFNVSVKVEQSDVPVVIRAIDSLGKQTTSVVLLTPKTGDSKGKKRELAPNVFGSYYALVIGIEKYNYWDGLYTPQCDAEDVAKVLKDKFGFKTKVLLNATRFDLLSALNEYQKELTERDNLLIYYAGHGYLDDRISRGYWIPVDGEKEVRANWISTFDITDMISILDAKHILVISDSCYSGILTRSAIPQIEGSAPVETRNECIKLMAGKKSRTVLTSGDLTPVLDGGGGNHSIFAKALLEVLSESNEVLEGMRLYKEVAARVTFAAASVYVEQVPQYAPLKYSGHEMGEFFLIPIH